MIKQSNVQGRLNLFRYGVVVVIVTAFVASLAAPIVLTADLGEFSLGFGDVLMPSLIITGITAVIGIVSYMAYAQLLKRTVGSGDSA